MNKVYNTQSSPHETDMEPDVHKDVTSHLPFDETQQGVESRPLGGKISSMSPPPLTSFTVVHSPPQKPVHDPGIVCVCVCVCVNKATITEAYRHVVRLAFFFCRWQWHSSHAGIWVGGSLELIRSSCACVHPV